MRHITNRFGKYLPLLICFIFFIAYSTLSVVKHNHYLSGYDLAVSDQGIWLMSKLKNPISTVHAYSLTSIYYDHVEIIYALLSPIYWFFDDIRILIVLQAFLISFSAISIYLMAKFKKVNELVIYALLISFLMFYGFQNAIWADVHSLALAAGFLPWFIYFLYKGQTKLTFLFFTLLIFCKEDIALLIFLISAVYYFFERKKIALTLMGLSVIYIFAIFFVYFPHFTPSGYRFQNSNGLLSNIDMSNMYNTSEKQDVIFYSLGWFGFLPLLSPLYLIPVIGDLFHYFVLGSNTVISAQGLFLHYRVTIAALLVWPTIFVIARYKRLNKFYTGLYLLIFAFAFQYMLHLPLSYFAKSWFWKEPGGVKNIEEVLLALPKNASVVSQVNIIPHINHREYIFTLWPEKKPFKDNSPCGSPTCDWFRWSGKPEYLLVDTSSDWDARYILTSNQEFRQGLINLEKGGIIKVEKRKNTATLYRVMKNP